MTTDEALAIVRGYHAAWTSKNFEEAGRFLADDLDVEVPINEYNTAKEFRDPLTAFGQLVVSVDVLAELGRSDEAMLLYDMVVEQLGPLRVAEHFTVAGGRITRIRQIHDTAKLREAGFAS